MRVLLFALALFVSAAHAQQLALTFDDGLDPARQPQAGAWNRDILDHLRDASIRSFLFPSLVRVGGEPGLDLVRDWAREGHGVGNHTATHRSYGSPRMELAEFTADVQRADDVLSAIPGFERRLRFPFLKEGETVLKRDGMRLWMREHDYRAAPVSIDASDWYYDQVLREARGDGTKEAAIVRAYVEHVVDRAGYYDTLARRVLGRSPTHVLLLHTNAINARALPQVIAALRKRRWKIVAARDAFEDPLYRMEPDILPAGESIVWALAKQAGVDGLRYPAEDSRYEEPRLRALGLVQ